MADGSVMMMETVKQTRQRNSFATSLQSAEIGNYFEENLNMGGSTEGMVSLRNMEGDYIPSFEGYLNLGFSIHVPCDHTTSLDCRLNIDESSQARLESLVMLFLCSQGAELVISTAPMSLVHVCPFNSNKSGAGTSPNKAMTKASANALLGGNPESEPMIVWNLPKFEYKTVAFDNKISTEKETVVDMATNTTFILANGPPQQYYTKLKFTYPVYQWGAEDRSIASALQNEFDRGVVSSGTLNSLLPWPGSIAASTGNEPYAFWDEPLPEPLAIFDTEIPQGVGLLLRYIGGGLIVTNTLAIIMLSVMARIRNKRKKSKARKTLEQKKHWSSSVNASKLSNEYLDTEAGVSAILMESKHYALAKSEAYVRSRSSTSSASGSQQPPLDTGDRNITGVEVDLKMVDHPIHLNSNAIPSAQIHYDHLLAPPTSAERKEEMLLVKMRSAPNANQWFNGKRLLSSSGNGDGNDDYDDEDDEDNDLQILETGNPVRRNSTVSF